MLGFRFIVPILTFGTLACPAAALAQTTAAAGWLPPPPTPEDVRGLPACATGTPDAAPGEQYTCRPEMATPGLQMALTPVELSWGGMFAGAPVRHGAIAYAAGMDVGLSRSWAFGARYQYLGGGGRLHDEDGDGQPDVEAPYHGSHLVGGGPRFRLFTDETARQAWMLELDGGWSFVPGAEQLAGPYARASVGRQVGFFFDQTGAAQSALVVSYLHGFAGAEDLRALLFGVRLDLEWGIPMPLDVDEVPTPSSFAYTIGVQGGIVGAELGTQERWSMLPSLGLAVGLPISRGLEPRLLADMAWYGMASDRPAQLTYAGLGGLRLRLDEVAPVFVDAMAGWQAVTGMTPRPYDSGPVIDLAAGVSVGGCALGGGLGLRYRRGLLQRNEAYQALSLFVEMSWGNRRGALGSEPWPSGNDAPALSCDGGYRPGRAALPPPDPPPPPPPPVAPRGGQAVDARGSVAEGGGAGPEASVAVQARVEPVVIEVPLGVSLFGGAVRLSISPASLPTAELRGSDFASVEVIGPAAVLPSATAQLRAALGVDGERVETWSSTASDRSDVRARFTLWPVGARPRAP